MSQHKMTGRRLRVKTRKEPQPGERDQNWTLFARLSPQTARALSDGHGAPEFLPLELTGDTIDEPVYVSHNGGSIGESLLVSSVSLFVSP